MELCVELTNMTLKYYCTSSLSYIIKVISKFTPSLGPGLLDLQILISSNWKIMELMSVVSQDDGHLSSVTSERWI